MSKSFHKPPEYEEKPLKRQERDQKPKKINPKNWEDFLEDGDFEEEDESQYSR